MKVPAIRFKGAFANALSLAFGVGLLTSLLAFVRQALVAKHFGIGSDLDAYFMTFAIASFLSFTPGAIFQNASVPRLVQALEKGGRLEFESVAGVIFLLACVFALAIGAIYIALTPVIIHLFAPGFDAGQKHMVVAISIHFLPWVMIAAPYNAMGSILKSGKKYASSLSAELILTLVSIASLAIWHSNVKNIAWAYFLGHAVAMAWLAVHLFRNFSIKFTFNRAIARPILRNIAELYGAMQISSLSGLLDRMLQSFLAPGGISSLAYANQLCTAISGLLGFKQIYIVPLSGSDNRVQKLQRLLTGLIFLTMPIVTAISIYSYPAIEILYQRGEFSTDATLKTSQLLSILGFTVFSATLNSPLVRMYQVIDKIRLSAWTQSITLVTFGVMGAVFLFGLKMGAAGLALTVVLNSYLSVLISLFFLRRSGIRLPLRPLGRILVGALLSNCAVFLLVEYLFRESGYNLPALLGRVAVWVTLTAAVYWTQRKTIYWAINARPRGREGI